MTKKKTVIRSISIEAELDAALQAHMKAKNIRNVSRAVNDALRFALFPEGRDDRNHDLSKLCNQILYSLNEHRKKTGRDLAANQEIMLQFILDSYKQSSDTDNEAQKRLDDLMEDVVRNLGKAKRME